MLKDLAVVVDGRTKVAASYALSLALMHEAHLTAVSADISALAASYASAELRLDLILAEREQRQETASATIKKLSTDAAAQGLHLDALSLNYLEEDGLDRLNDIVRVFDLVIVEQAEAGSLEGRPRTIESVVFGSGRPVLIVPYIQSRPATLKNILIAWDASTPAARALGDSLPLLSKANRVELLRIDGNPAAEYDGKGVCVTRHLGRHGIDASFKRTTSAGDFGNTLLSHAADTGADLLVMGAYGHSRLREALLGGTTRTLLQSMTIPVLMSH